MVFFIPAEESRGETRCGDDDATTAERELPGTFFFVSSSVTADLLFSPTISGCCSRTDSTPTPSSLLCCCCFFTAGAASFSVPSTNSATCDSAPTFSSISSSTSSSSSSSSSSSDEESALLRPPDGERLWREGVGAAVLDDLEGEGGTGPRFEVTARPRSTDCGNNCCCCNCCCCCGLSVGDKGGCCCPLRCAKAALCPCSLVV
mmetsp:Transcript_54263/g.107739  ORF Transcript_54263/g.107739 Transcript_54263/m.107739 type:complete len:204 (+) Transcript_54263:82-693(+)